MDRLERLHYIFQEEGKRICKHQGAWNDTAMRRYRSTFGTSPLVSAKLWIALEQYHAECAAPKHLLFALVFLNLYQSEHVSRIICDGVDEKTFRKYVWTYIGLIAERLTHLVSSFVLCRSISIMVL
jgi:hypothetical protein